MTKLLESAMVVAGALSPEMQDDLARMILTFAGVDLAPAELTEEDETAVLLSRAAAAGREFATDAAVSAIWAKHAARHHMPDAP